MEPTVLLDRRPLLVAVDGSGASTRRLVRALQEAVRRETSVLAVALLESDSDDDLRSAARTLLDAQLLHAIEQAGVHGRARATLLDPDGFRELTGLVARQRV